MDLWIRIRSLFEGKGTAEAAQGVDKVTDAAKRTPPAMAKAGGSADKAFSSINAAAQVTEGGLAGLGNTVKNLGEQFPGLGSAALGPIGLIIAAFASWKKVVDSVREAREGLARGLRETAAGNYDASVKRQAAAYAELYNAIRRTAEERQRLSDIEQARDDAVLRSDLAKLELEKAQAMAGLAPDDEAGRRALELDAQTRRSELEEAAALRKSSREDGDLAAKESELRQTIAAKKAEMTKLEEQFAKRLADNQQTLDAAVKNSGRWYRTAAGSQNIWDSAAPALEKGSEAATKAFEQREAAAQAVYEAQQALVELRGKRQVNAIDRGTLGTSGQTRKVTEWVQERDNTAAANASVDAELKGLNDRLAGATPQMVAAFQAMVAGAERNGELTVSWVKALAAANERIFQQLKDAQAAARVRQ